MLQLTLDLTGKELKHKVFGIGTVKSHVDGILEIEFNVGIKKFQYPAAISGGFLSAIDDEAAIMTSNEIYAKIKLDLAEKELSFAKIEYKRFRKAMGIE